MRWTYFADSRPSSWSLTPVAADHAGIEVMLSDIATLLGFRSVTHFIVSGVFEAKCLIRAAEPQITRHPSCCQEISDQYYWPGELIQNWLCNNKRRADKAKFQNRKKQ